jgi:WD40 repeat protein
MFMSRETTLPLEHVRRSHKGNRYAASAWSGRCIVYTPSKSNLSRLQELDKLNDGEDMLLLRGHAGAVTHACWSPDDEFIATCSVDHTVRLWNSKTGKQLLILLGHTEIIRSVEWSPDGKFLASGGDDATLRVWNVGKWMKTQNPADIYITRTFNNRNFRSHSESILSLAWSPENKRKLAIGWHDECVQVLNVPNEWKFPTGVNVPGQGHFDLVYRLDENKVNIVKDEKQKNGSMKRVRVSEATQDCRHVHAMQWSPDGKYLATAGAGRSLRLWDEKTGVHLYCIENMASSQVWGLEWNKKKIAVGGESGTVLVFDTVKLTTDRFGGKWDLRKKAVKHYVAKDEAKRRYNLLVGEANPPDHRNEFKEFRRHMWVDDNGETDDYAIVEPQE